LDQDFFAIPAAEEGLGFRVSSGVLKVSIASRVTCHHVYSSTLDLEIVLWIIDL
jgi:hypothetical protein